MSNFQAISTVTAVLGDLLSNVNKEMQELHDKNPIIPNIDVGITFKPPHSFDSSPQTNSLNLYLYQVTPNSAYSNTNLPSRSADGKAMKAQTVMGLDLHYLITPYASGNDEIINQLMLASTMRILHENPHLTRSRIHDLSLNPSNIPWILENDLENQIELIKIFHERLTLDEITKLWSSFFQTNYRLSIAYQATAVILTSKKEYVSPLPVSKRSIFVSPFNSPVIEKIEPQILEWSTNARITIRGHNLSDSLTAVKFDNMFVRSPEDTTNNSVVTPIPIELTVGVKSVKVIHRQNIGNSDNNSLPILDGDDGVRQTEESNAGVFVFVPKIISIVPTDPLHNTDVKIEFQPPISAFQKDISVIIGSRSFTEIAVSNTNDGGVIGEGEGEGEGGNTANAGFNKVSVHVPEDFSPGEYFVRLRIGGSESLLERDKDDVAYIGPKITVR